jgi:tetratricopeptide (TPR) repeat protein
MFKSFNKKYFFLFLIWIIILLLFTELGARLYFKSRLQPNIRYHNEYNRIIEENAAVLNQDPQKRGITIFFFGGSTMAGFPFNPIVSPVTWIEAFFKHIYPDTKVNLINFGEGGKNSIYIEKALKKSLIYAPDIVVILFGHNEFLRNISAHDKPVKDFLIKHSALINLIDMSFASLQEKIKLNKFRQKVLESVNTSSSSENKAHDHEKVKLTKDKSNKSVMQKSPSTLNEKINFFHSVDYKWVILDSPEMKQRLSEFQNRFTHIIGLCHQENVTVLAATPPYNMKFRPYGRPLSVKGQELKRWIDHAQKGFSLYNKGLFKDALDEFLKADTIDGANALLSSYIAHSYEEIGDFTMAKQYYHKTSIHDIRRSSIFSNLEKVIRETCIEEDVPYHNIQKDFTAISRQGIVGHKYIIDNVHPNLKGQYILSQSLFKHIINNISLFPKKNLIFPDYHSLIEKFSLQKEFNYVKNKHLGDYYVNHFDEALLYYKKAFEAMPTQEICIRIIQLCMKHDRYQQARPCLEKVMKIQTRGYKFRVPEI